MFESIGPILSVKIPQRFDTPTKRYPIVKTRLVRTFCASHVTTPVPLVLPLDKEDVFVSSETELDAGTHSSLYCPSSTRIGYSAGHPKRMEPVRYT